MDTVIARIVLFYQFHSVDRQTSRKPLLICPLTFTLLFAQRSVSKTGMRGFQGILLSVSPSLLSSTILRLCLLEGCKTPPCREASFYQWAGCGGVTLSVCSSSAGFCCICCTNEETWAWVS